MQVVILAGGKGTRLWPVSRKDFPKQFLSFGDHESLLQKTVKRFLHAPFTENILISTSEAYASLVETEIAKVDGDKRCEILVEPEAKNTAAAISFAVKTLEEKGRDTSEILIVPSDHYLSPEESLYTSIERARKWISKGKIATFGVRPHQPETGYGYIQLRDKLGEACYQVEAFIEKPPLEKAKAFVLSGKYLWNSGMFAFSSKVFWEEMAIHAPQYAQKDIPFASLPSLSIDYALMEKTKKMVVLSMDVSWSDIGSWDRVYDFLDKDQNQNVKIGNVIDIETKNSLIIGGKKLISTIGLENMLIVETDEAIFIAKKGESEKVKQLIQKIKNFPIV